MDEIQSVQPTAVLRPYVRALAQRCVHIVRLPVTEPCPARLEQVLEFELADPFQIDFVDRPSVMTPKVAVVGANTQLNATVRLFIGWNPSAPFFNRRVSASSSKSP